MAPDDRAHHFDPPKSDQCINMILRIRKHKAIVFVGLVGLGTAFAPFVGAGQRNYLVVLIAALSVPIMFTLQFRSLRDLSGSVLIICYMLVTSLLNDLQNNVTSIIFTGMFMATYTAFSTALASRMVTREEIIGLLRAFICAFGAVSVLQAATALAGLPVPNLILSKGMWSYNSLAPEPSHMARLLSLTILAYLTLLRSTPGGRLSAWNLLMQERLVLVAFLTSIALSGSALGVIAAPLAIILAFPNRWILAFGAILMALWPVLFLIETPTITRSLVFVSSLSSMDIETLANADHSASVRFMPTAVYLQKGIADFRDFFFGMGPDALEPYFQGTFIGVEEDTTAGFFPGFLIAYGLLGIGLFLWVFVLRFLRPITFPFIFFWTILYLVTGWNTQGFWFGLIMLRVLHHYTRADAAEPVRVLSAQTTPGTQLSNYQAK